MYFLKKDRMQEYNHNLILKWKFVMQYIQINIIYSPGVSLALLCLVF